MGKTKSSLEMALKNGKAGGPDGIISEIFKPSAIFLVSLLVKNCLIDYLRQVLIHKRGQKQLFNRS